MLYANHWEYWQLYQKVTFDGVAKTIAVNPNVTTLNIRSDVYSAWVDWLVVGTNAVFKPAIRSSGYDPIPGGFTGDVYFLFNGWKLLVDLRKVAISGVLYSDDYSTAYYDDNLTPQYPAVVSSLVNVVSTPTNVVTGTALTVEQTANAVWQAAQRTITQNIPTASENALATKAGLSNEINKLAEVWARLGLDPTKPLVTGQTQITFGDIVMAMTGDSTTTTVTRL